MPLPAELAAWLQAYADEHYRPEPKKRRRPQSFLAPGRAAMSAASDDGFLRAGRGARRRSRRGAGASRSRRSGCRRASPRRRGAPRRAPAPPPPAAAQPAAAAPETAPAAEPPPPPPTLDDVARADPDSDYSRFVGARRRPGGQQRGDEEAVQRPALQRHGRPRHLHRRLRQARPDPARRCCARWSSRSSLGLFDDEEDADEAAPPTLPRRGIPDGAAPPQWQSRSPCARCPRPPADEDPDLRLQPDDAAGRPGAGAGRSGLTRAPASTTVHSTAVPARGRRVPARRQAAATTLLVACTQESRLFLELNEADRRRGQRRRAADPLRQHPRDRRLVEGRGGGAAEDRGADRRGAAAASRSRSPPVSYASAGRVPRHRRGRRGRARGAHCSPTSSTSPCCAARRAARCRRRGRWRSTPAA